MKHRKQLVRVLAGLLVVGLVFAGFIVLGGSDIRAEAEPPVRVGTETVTVGAADGAGSGQPAFSPASLDTAAGVLSVAGSTMSTRDCYEPDKTQTLCFTVHNGSTDSEWLDFVRLTFPEGAPPLGPWDVTCGTQDPADSSGAPVSLQCDGSSVAHQVVYTDSDADGHGEITAGASWGFCVQAAIPVGYDGERQVHWGVGGDGDGLPPHDLAGMLLMEACTPLMLYPDAVAAEGCNGVVQTLGLELSNKSAGDGAFNLSYDVSSQNAELRGPQSVYLGDGDTVTFTVELEPALRLAAGDVVNALVEVGGNEHSDSASLVYTVTETAGWQTLPYTSPVPAMDNVVVWASQVDNGLWSIGGYGSNGATQRYDPEANTWTLHAPETDITPTIEYPMDGCYGINDQDEEIIVLFPDTIVTDTLHVYNITQDTWTERPIPGFYPVEGRWGQDVVSMLSIPRVEENVCYLTGGSTQEGGGRTRDLWLYHPVDNGGQYLGNFPGSVWFGFHASWYVPWVGSAGAICVAGGIDHYSNVTASSQCYDLETKQFNLVVDADLGPLPEPWWGMADGWQMVDGEYQIWLANGVAQDGTLLPASTYASETSGGFQMGPAVPKALYRLEGDSWEGQFYILNGAQGGFNYSNYAQTLVPCPTCYSVYLPLTLRDFTGHVAR